MKTRFFNYLRFNRAERNGTIVLFLMATVFFIAPVVSRYFQGSSDTNFEPFQGEINAFREGLAKGRSEAAPPLFNFDPNTATFEDFIRLGLSEKVSNMICNYRDKGGNFREASDFQKIWGLSKTDFDRLLPYIQVEATAKKNHETIPNKPEVELFTFDPNTISEPDLFKLGLPARTVKSILNYRNKGGKFRRKEDLEKIYALLEDDYVRIAPYATFQEATSSARPITYAGGMAAPVRQVFSPQPIDINRADIAHWMSLPGIGEIRAKQLVNFREKLGGFTSIAQLGEMHGLPDSVFQNIRSSLSISTENIRKININTASVADLNAHPYISKRQAELIVAYREQHGAFVSVEDLSEMRAFSDQAWLQKVKPYLGVE